MKKKVKKAKVVRGKVVTVKKGKKKKPKSLSSIIFRSVMETLEANSEGEFDPPTNLIRYLDKSDPRSRLGLHREAYFPAGRKIPFYPPDSMEAKMIFQSQASIVVGGLLGEGYPVRTHRFTLPLCEDCS